jgi:hypothetical protein
MKIVKTKDTATSDFHLAFSPTEIRTIAASKTNSATPIPHPKIKNNSVSINEAFGTTPFRTDDNALIIIASTIHRSVTGIRPSTELVTNNQPGGEALLFRGPTRRTSAIAAQIIPKYRPARTSWFASAIPLATGNSPDASAYLTLRITASKVLEHNVVLAATTASERENQIDNEVLLNHTVT